VLFAKATEKGKSAMERKGKQNKKEGSEGKGQGYKKHGHQCCTKDRFSLRKTAER
jgi:hypothetical protein